MSQSLQQDGDAGQPPGAPLVVPVAKHQAHQLRVSGAHGLLKNCQSRKTCRQRLRVKQPQSLRTHLKWMKSRRFRRRWGSEGCPNQSRPVESLGGSRGCCRLFIHHSSQELHTGSPSLVFFESICTSPPSQYPGNSVLAGASGSSTPVHQMVV